MASLIVTYKPQKGTVQLRENSETLSKSRGMDLFEFFFYSDIVAFTNSVKLSFICRTVLLDKLSHQWQAFHENIIGEYETKEYLRGRSSHLRRKKKSVCVQEARGVRDRLTLSALCRLLCVRVCVCLPQHCHLFSSELLQHFSFCFFFFLSTAVSFPCPVLFHCLSCSCAAENDFYQFQTLSLLHQTIVFCYAYWHILMWWFSAWSCVCNCALRCDYVPCMRPSRDRQ